MSLPYPATLQCCTVHMATTTTFLRAAMPCPTASPPVLLAINPLVKSLPWSHPHILLGIVQNQLGIKLSAQLRRQVPCERKTGKE